MRWDPAAPDAPGSDRLVLSEGHAVPIVYAACADLGVMACPDGVPSLAGPGDHGTPVPIKVAIRDHVFHSRCMCQTQR